MALITPITGFVTNPMTEDLQCNGQILNDIATFKTAVLRTNSLDTVTGSLATQIDIDDNVNMSATKRIDFTGTGEIERGITGQIRFVNLPTTGSPATNLLGYNTATNVVETTALSAPTDWSMFPAISNPDIASFQINNLRNITGTDIIYDFNNNPTKIDCLSAIYDAGTSRIAINTPINEIRLQGDGIFLEGKITGANAPSTGFFLGNNASSFFEWKNPNAITVGFTNAYNNVSGAVAGSIAYNISDNVTAWLAPPSQDNCFLKFNQSVTPNRFEWELTSVTQFRQSKMFPQNVIENPYGNLNTGSPVLPSDTYYECAVNHPNGYIYFIPFSTRRISILNPETGISNIYSGFTNLTASAYVCAITASNMRIYAPPNGASGWLVYDPYTNTITTIPSATTGFVSVTQVGNFLYALTTNGTSTSAIYKLDITTNIETLVASVAGSYWGCSIGVDGRIYYAPYASTNILVLNPITDTTTTIATGLTLGSAMYKSVCMAKNGNLYFAPYNTTQIMILNTRTSTVSFLGTFSGSNLYSGITASTNDRLYLCPFGANNIPIVDPGAGTVDTTTITGLNATFGTQKWSQLLLLQNATEMVLVPYRITFGGGITEPSTRTIKTGQPIIPAWMLSQNLNKQ